MGSSNQTLVTLLHNRECPFDYQCMACDCIECVKMHMEKGETDGKSKSYNESRTGIKVPAQI